MKLIKNMFLDILEFLDVILTECPKVWKKANPKPLSPKTASNPSQTKLKKGEKNQRKNPKGKQIKEKPASEQSKEMLLFMNAILEENFVVKTLKQVINGNVLNFTAVFFYIPYHCFFMNKKFLKNFKHIVFIYTNWFSHFFLLITFINCLYMYIFSPNFCVFFCYCYWSQRISLHITSCIRSAI